jgi:3-hydroxyacyl-CoA dehydrogenase/enoyl-CoA hydratase/3-hydroxybutyryl-CoA epimerase
MNLTNFKWDQDADGIVTLIWDVPGRSMNVLTNSAIAELAQVAEKVASDATDQGPRHHQRQVERLLRRRGAR